MKYEEIVQKVRESFATADVSDYKEHLAIQFNITGEGGGAFYVELKNGTIDVQPYEYFDRDVIFTMSADDLFLMIDDKLDTVKAYLEHRIDVSDVNVALKVKKIIDDINAKELKAKKEAEKLAKKKAEEEEKLAKQKAEEEKKAKAEAEKIAKEKEVVKTTTTTAPKKVSAKNSKTKKSK